jgi:hypothetical protein
MAKRKLVNPQTGKPQEAELVEVVAVQNDQPVIIQLADGSTLRLRLDLVEVVRFDGYWDNERMPLYSVRTGTAMIVLDAPESLKKQ